MFSIVFIYKFTKNNFYFKFSKLIILFLSKVSKNSSNLFIFSKKFSSLLTSTIIECPNFNENLNIVIGSKNF